MDVRSNYMILWLIMAFVQSFLQTYNHLCIAEEGSLALSTAPDPENIRTNSKLVKFWPNINKIILYFLEGQIFVNSLFTSISEITFQK